MEKDAKKFKAFLERNIYECRNHEEYIRLNGGAAKMQALRGREFLLDKEN